MTKQVTIPPAGFDDLTVEEQIDYVQSLWERIAATPDQVPVPDWHREVLDERLKDYEANPDAGESWDVVRDRLRDKLPPFTSMPRRSIVRPLAESDVDEAASWYENQRTGLGLRLLDASPRGVRSIQ